MDKDELKIRRAAAKRQAHAATCKKPLDSCPTCKRNVEWFAALPPHLLNKVLK